MQGYVAEIEKQSRNFSYRLLNYNINGFISPPDLIKFKGLTKSPKSGMGHLDEL